MNKQPEHIISENITIVGSRDGRQYFNKEDIMLATKTKPETLYQGGEFTGQLNTTIIRHNNCIVKFKSPLALDKKSIHQWIEKRLLLERKWQIHMPEKTWFFIERDSTFYPGNITPLVQPLHVALGVVPSKHFAPVKTHEQRLDIFVQLFELYFSFAVKYDKRQDEGLSNYGLTQCGRVYYLDDDIYDWDCFLTFSQILGVYIRTLSWLNNNFSGQLAAVLRDTILTTFDHDQHCLRIIQEHLRGLFLAREKQAILRTFNNTLSRPAQRYSTHKGGKHFDLLHDSYAVLADIHANETALLAVMEDMKANGIQHAVVLGDCVGYGPSPGRCIELLKNSQFLIIQGNHDHAAGTNTSLEKFSRHGKISTLWTRDQLSHAEKKWLSELTPIIKSQHCWLVHGAPMDPTFFNAYVYHMTFEKNLDFMQQKKLSLCFHAHTHIPRVYARKANTDDHILTTDTMLHLQQYTQRLICPGSVGQPRDGSHSAHYAIWHGAKQKLESKCIQYDVHEVITAMRKNNFPETLRTFQSRLLLDHH